MNGCGGSNHSATWAGFVFQSSLSCMELVFISLPALELPISRLAGLGTAGKAQSSSIVNDKGQCKSALPCQTSCILTASDLVEIHEARAQRIQASALSLLGIKREIREMSKASYIKAITKPHKPNTSLADPY